MIGDLHTNEPSCCLLCLEFCKRFKGYKEPETEETPVPVKIVPSPK